MFVRGYKVKCIFICIPPLLFDVGNISAVGLDYFCSLKLFYLYWILLTVLLMAYYNATILSLM